MAFIFNPNPSEGDKQTNPDTGVEYIYSGGAWRALGPKIEDEFDALDGRYVKLTGTSRTTGNWKIKGDNEAGDGERTYQSIGDGYQKLYHIQTPEDSNTGWVANVEYVQEKIAAIPAPTGGGVPVGSIMIWMNSTAPAGWFKLQGGSFDTSTYPQLHAYLQNTSGYTSGTLPSWRGHYPGEYGSHLADSLGKKVGQRTAEPSGGSPKSSASIPNGKTRTFNGAGGTSAYSDGTSKVTINDGWDSYTRPQTVIVHYIIKHD